MKTTLNKIRLHAPCRSSWVKLLGHLGKTKADDAELSIVEILDILGLNDALWCMCAVEGCDREIRLYAIWCARRWQHLLTDPRSIAGLDIAEKYLAGEVSSDEFERAGIESSAASWESLNSSAGFASWVAAWALRASAVEAARAASPTDEQGVKAGEARLREICSEIQHSSEVL